MNKQPILDTTSAAAVYSQLRVDLIAAGATDIDFECLTEHLIGLVIEHGSTLSTRETWKALLDLISTGFACRGFSVVEFSPLAGRNGCGDVRVCQVLDKHDNNEKGPVEEFFGRAFVVSCSLCVRGRAL